MILWVLTCPPSLSTSGATQVHTPLLLHSQLLLLQSAEVWQAVCAGMLEALTASDDCKSCLP